MGHAHSRKNAQNLQPPGFFQHGQGQEAHILSQHQSYGKDMLRRAYFNEVASQHPQYMKRRLHEQNIQVVDTQSAKKPKTENSRKKYEKKNKSSNVPNRWTKEEDELLKKAVNVHKGKNWKGIADMVPNRSHVQCLQRWKKVLKPGLVKGHWKPEEDELLKQLVHDPDLENWAMVAQHIDGRTAKQCRERWRLNLDPTISREPWSKNEDAILIDLHNVHGNKWSFIASSLPGRTENAVKTRFKSIMRAKKRQWTAEEDQKLIMLQAHMQRQWSEIAEKFPNRSKHAVKTRFKELQKQSYENSGTEKAVTGKDAVSGSSQRELEKNAARMQTQLKLAQGIGQELVNPQQGTVDAQAEQYSSAYAPVYTGAANNVGNPSGLVNLKFDQGLYNYAGPNVPVSPYSKYSKRMGVVPNSPTAIPTINKISSSNNNNNIGGIQKTMSNTSATSIEDLVANISVNPTLDQEASYINELRKFLIVNGGVSGSTHSIDANLNNSLPPQRITSYDIKHFLDDIDFANEDDYFPGGNISTFLNEQASEMQGTQSPSATFNNGRMKPVPAMDISRNRLVNQSSSESIERISSVSSLPTNILQVNSLEPIIDKPIQYESVMTLS